MNALRDIAFAIHEWVRNRREGDVPPNVSLLLGRISGHLMSANDEIIGLRTDNDMLRSRVVRLEKALVWLLQGKDLFENIEEVQKLVREINGTTTE